MNEYDFWHLVSTMMVPIVCGVIIAAAHAFFRTFFPSVYPFLNQSPWAHIKRLTRRLTGREPREPAPSVLPVTEVLDRPPPRREDRN